MTRIDLVETQFLIAAGKTLADLSLSSPPPLFGHAVQCRVSPLLALWRCPSQRVVLQLVITGPVVVEGITGYKEPSGPGVRVDSCGYEGYMPAPYFDPLLAKIVCTASTLPGALASAKIALREFWVAGVSTNRTTLQAIVNSPILAAGLARTSFMLEDLPEEPSTESDSTVVSLLQAASTRPLETKPSRAEEVATAPEGFAWVLSPLQGQVVAVEHQLGELVAGGGTVAVLLSMKMEHPICATQSGTISEILVAPHDIVQAGAPIALLKLLDDATLTSSVADESQKQPGSIRADLQEVIDRQLIALDEARLDHDPAFGQRVARRREAGLRTARGSSTGRCMWS